MELNKKTVGKILLIITFTILLYVGLQNFTSVAGMLGTLYGIIAPFITGLCVAFILNVPMRLFENRVFAGLNRKNNRIWQKLRRPVCLILAMLVVALVLALVLVLVIPELIRSVTTLARAVPASVEKFQVWLNQVAEWAASYGLTLQSLSQFNVDWGKLGQTVVDFLTNGAGEFVFTTMNITTSIFSGIFHFVLAFVFSIYVLLQKERLAGQVRRVLYAFLPERAASRALEIAALSNRTFTNFITGQLTEAVIIGGLCFVGMALLRIPYSLMISVLVGFTALIPVFGAFIGTFVGAFLILMVQPIKAVVFIIFIIVLQQVEGNLIYPRVVGTSVGLPGIWVLAAVTIGGSAMGVVGMLVSVPLFSVLYSLFRETVAGRLNRKGWKAAP